MKPVVFRLALQAIAGHTRRTVLTVTAVAVGVAALIFLWGFNDGLHRNMLGNFQQTIIGSLQIHRRGFFDNPELARHIADEEPILQALERAGVRHWTRRLETFALAASDSATEGSFLVGVDPQHEPEVTRLHRKVTRGRFLLPDDEYSCVLGASAARNLGLELGDTLVLVAYDRFGVMAAEQLELVGVIDSGEMGIDRGLVLVPLASLQEMLEMTGRITDIPVRVAESELERVAAELETALAAQDLEVLRWYDMFPVMQEWVTLHNGFLYLFLGIVLLIVLSGVLNTMLLSMLERVRELGILLALGNRNVDVGLLVMTESLLLGLAGVGLGTLAGVLVVAMTRHTGIDLSIVVGATERFYIDPVIRPHLDLTHLATTLGAVLTVTLLAGLYPAWKAVRLAPAEAIRHG